MSLRRLKAEYVMLTVVSLFVAANLVQIALACKAGCFQGTDYHDTADTNDWRSTNGEVCFDMGYKAKEYPKFACKGSGTRLVVPMSNASGCRPTLGIGENTVGGTVAGTAEEDTLRVLCSEAGSGS